MEREFEGMSTPPDPRQGDYERAAFLGGMEMGWLARLKNWHSNALWLLMGAIAIMSLWTLSLHKDIATMRREMVQLEARTIQRAAKAESDAGAYWLTSMNKINELRLAHGLEPGELPNEEAEQD